MEKENDCDRPVFERMDNIKTTIKYLDFDPSKKGANVKIIYTLKVNTNVSIGSISDAFSFAMPITFARSSFSGYPFSIVPVGQRGMEITFIAELIYVERNCIPDTQILHDKAFLYQVAKQLNGVQPEIAYIVT